MISSARKLAERRTKVKQVANLGSSFFILLDFNGFDFFQSKIHLFKDRNKRIKINLNKNETCWPPAEEYKQMMGAGTKYHLCLLEGSLTNNFCHS